MLTHPNFRPKLEAIGFRSELGIVSAATSAACVAAALLSVLIFPLTALIILRRDEPTPALEQAAALPAKT